MASSERHLAYRVFIYYVFTFAGLMLLGNLFPDTQPLISSAATEIAAGDLQLEQALSNGAVANADVPVGFTLFNDRAIALLIALFSTVIFTVPLAWTFGLSHPHTEQHSSIRETIFLLPITVASVVVIVQHSIALAFSLAGIVAAVRFRSNIKTPADAMFVFAALAIGLAAGVSEIGVAGVGSMFFCFTYILLRISGVVHDIEEPLTDPVGQLATAADLPQPLVAANSDLSAARDGALEEAQK